MTSQVRTCEITPTSRDGSCVNTRVLCPPSNLTHLEWVMSTKCILKVSLYRNVQHLRVSLVQHGRGLQYFNQVSEQIVYPTICQAHKPPSEPPPHNTMIFSYHGPILHYATRYCTIKPGKAHTLQTIGHGIILDYYFRKWMEILSSAMKWFFRIFFSTLACFAFLGTQWKTWVAKS